MYVLLLALFSVSASAIVSMEVGNLHFGPGKLAREWVSPDGRMCQQNQVQGMSTALDLWPAPGVPPKVDSLAELTLHRTGWWDPKMERFSISAMANGAYRFGVERSGGGKYQDMLFCFEDYAPGVAQCVLKLTPEGVYVGAAGQPWRKL